jgi:hypothetical protein
MAEQAEYGLTRTDLRILKQVVGMVLGGQINLGPQGREGRPTGTRLLLGKRTSDVAKGASADFTIYTGLTKGSETSAGFTINAYCRMAPYTANHWAYLEPVDSGWEAVPECV